jgi:histidinol-phosphate aminotransferase
MSEIHTRAGVSAMAPYTPVEPPEVWAARLGVPLARLVKLDANENPYGPSPRARAALANLSNVYIYPDPNQRELRQALATYVQAPVEQILAGAGSDELIDLILRATLEPGDVVLDCPPTFGMYRFCTAVCGGRIVNVPRRADFSLDVAAIEQAARETQARVLFVTSPNNPDGSLTPPEDIARLVRLPLLVVVDEAYIEFADRPSLIGSGLEAENLIVLRTFSKWAGLAGIRLGYGVFPLALMEHLWKIKQPYNVNVAAAAMGIASLQDVEHLRGNVARLVDERERLQRELARVPFLRPYPSQSNFILSRVVGRDARDLWQTMRQRGILLRYFEQPAVRDCIRISAGTPEQGDRVLEELRAI